MTNERKNGRKSLKNAEINNLVSSIILSHAEYCVTKGSATCLFCVSVPQTVNTVASLRLVALYRLCTNLNMM